MGGNKKVKEAMIEIYGEECFIEKLHLRKEKEPKKYSSNGQMKKMKMLTYHHIKERSKGGKATIENGALLSAENHAWFNKQKKECQKYMNDLFQEYKRQIDKNSECRIITVDDLDIPFSINSIEFYVDERGKYNRAKKKQEDRNLINKYYEEEEK